MNFNTWYANADIPMQINGKWVDVESGEHFEDAIKVGVAAKAAPSSAVIDARNVAKSFGGKALLGSAAQKEWAESIRAGVLKSVSEANARILCKEFPHSKFWIENRKRDIPGLMRSQPWVLIPSMKVNA